MEGLKLLLSERGLCSTELRLDVADADVAEVPALMQTKRVSQVSHMLQRLRNFLVADVVEQTLQMQLLPSHPVADDQKLLPLVLNAKCRWSWKCVWPAQEPHCRS
jgi:hypothetical protein